MRSLWLVMTGEYSDKQAAAACSSYEQACGVTLRLLALPYADHPDYRAGVAALMERRPTHEDAGGCERGADRFRNAFPGW